VSGITVLHVGGIGAEAEGQASVRRFLNEATVGAQLVEGIAYELPPGARYAPREGASRHQVFYVTSGSVEALFQGKRHELVPGRGVYCEPGETCELENAGDEPATFYRFLVTPS
jgi:quercetin dioxygenase-like cupin family protein